MADLIAHLGERKTEDKIISHLKPQCLIHGQRIFTKFNCSYGEIPFFTYNQSPPDGGMSIGSEL